MTVNSDTKRIQQLYKLLDTYHEKLGFVEQDLAKSVPGEGRAAMRLQIKDIWKDIRDHEIDLGDLLSRCADAKTIPGNEADDALAELNVHVDRLKGADKSNWPVEVLAKLDDLQAKLSEPGKAAAAKLKVSLPIIPLLVSYELEMDTESTLVQVWHKITGLFRKSLPDPTKA